MRFTSLLLVAGILGSAVLAAAAPEGSVLRWKLKIAPDASMPRNPAGRLVVKPQKGPEQVYWYVVYSVTNTHDAAVKLPISMSATTDANDAVSPEGYYPRALAKLKARYGADVKDMLELNGLTLAPGESVRGVAVFQIFEPGGTPGHRKYEERVDELTIHVDGYCDPLKFQGLEFSKDPRQLLMHFEKRGDQYDPARESVRFVRSEEVAKS